MFFDFLGCWCLDFLGGLSEQRAVTLLSGVSAVSMVGCTRFTLVRHSRTHTLLHHSVHILISLMSFVSEVVMG